MNSKFLGILIATSLLVAADTMSYAQSTNSSSGQSSISGSSMMSDTAFIKKNIMDNMTEIQLLQMGENKSSSPQIKSMSRQMIADHAQMLSDLQKIARKKNMAVADNNIGITSPSATATDATDMNSKSITGATPGSVEAATVTSGSGTTGTAMGTSGSSRKGKRTNTLDSGMNAAGTASGTTTSASGMNNSNSTTSNNTAATGTTGTTATSSVDTASGAAASTTPTYQGIEKMSTINDTSGMQALQTASGAAFNKMFISEMLTMHQAKLAELEAASTKVTDPELKLAVVKATAKVRMHTDMLSMANKRNQ